MRGGGGEHADKRALADPLWHCEPLDQALCTRLTVSMQNRYQNETRRLYSVYEEQLKDKDWLVGNKYSVRA